ncbi:MAG: Calx-beta domain-containing protein [Pseudomonadota bacterium]
MRDSLLAIDWSDFSGSDPAHFLPYNLVHPVAKPKTWGTGGYARWPDGSWPGVGRIVVAGSDDLTAYDPYKDILVFGYRDADRRITEMSSRDHSVCFEELDEGLWDLKIMPLSDADGGEPVATIQGLIQDDLGTIIESWVPTEDGFQADLVAAVFCVEREDHVPANHIAVLTHEEGAVTRYNFAEFQSVHQDDVVLNFTTMTGRALRADYDESKKSLRIEHYDDRIEPFNAVWGTTIIENITPDQLKGLNQLWSRDATLEQEAVLRGRFNTMIRELVGDTDADASVEDAEEQTAVAPDPEVTAPVTEPTVSVEAADFLPGTVQAAQFHLTLSQSSDRDVLVAIATGDGESVSGETATVRIPVGKTRVTATVDLLDGAAETLSMRIVSADGAKVGRDRAEVALKAQPAAVPKRRTARRIPAKLLPAEHRPADRNTGPMAAENPVPPTITFVLDLDAPFDEEFSLSYWTEDITAIAGEDYLPASGRVVFAPGETSKRVAVNLPVQTTTDPDQTFRFVVDGGEDGPIQVIATVQDDASIAQKSLR